jgi:hypothetical protein
LNFSLAQQESFCYYGIKIEAKATEEEQKGDNQDDIPDSSCQLNRSMQHHITP